MRVYAFMYLSIHIYERVHIVYRHPYAHTHTHAHTQQLVLLLRLSPLLPFALSNYLYGMTRVNFLEYLAGTAIGFAPGSLGFVMSGQVHISADVSVYIMNIDISRQYNIYIYI